MKGQILKEKKLLVHGTVIQFCGSKPSYHEEKCSTNKHTFHFVSKGQKDSGQMLGVKIISCKAMRLESNQLQNPVLGIAN